MLALLRQAMHGRGLKSQLIRISFWSISLRVSYAASAFLLAVTLARTMGAESYGLYTFVFTLVSLVGIPVKLGLPELAVRETARFQVQEEWGRLKGLWQWSLYFVLGIAALLIPGYVFFVAVFGEHLDATLRSTLLFGILLMPVMALSALGSGALKGLRRVIIGQVESVMIPTVLMVLALGMFLMSRAELAAPTVMCLRLIAVGITLVFVVVMLSRLMPDQVKTVRPIKEDWRNWLGSAIPLSLITGLSFINGQTDILMLGMLSDSTAVGVYKVVVSSATLVAFGGYAINSVVSPYFSRMYAQGDMVKLQSLVTMAAQISFLFAAPVALVLLVWGDRVLGFFFGETFVTGYAALAILAVGQMLGTLFGAVAFLLNMTGHERQTLKALFASGMANIIMNAALIPLYGIEGAAFSSVVSLMMWSVYLFHVARTRLGLTAFALRVFPVKLK